MLPPVSSASPLLATASPPPENPAPLSYRLQLFRQQRRLMLPAVLLFILVLAGISLYSSYQQTVQQARTHLRTSTEQIAGQFGRAVGAVDLLLRHIRHDLTRERHVWVQWPEKQGFEYLRARHPTSLPQLRDLILFDDTGLQHFISTRYPAPDIRVHDRHYFQELSGGKESTTDGPFVGRNSKRYTFALAYRLTDPVKRTPTAPEPPEKFRGIIFAALELAYFQELCGETRNFQQLDALLVTAEQQVLSSCRSADLSSDAPVAGQPLSKVLGAMGLPTGEESTLHQRLNQKGSQQLGHWLVQVSPVNGPGNLRIIGLHAEPEWLAPWISQRNLTLGLLLLLLPGLWLWWRHSQHLPGIDAIRELETRNQDYQLRNTELRAQLSSLQASQQRAEAVKSTFIASISHDLRQPLTGIRLNLASLPRYIEQGQKTRIAEALNSLNNASEQLQAQFNSMLDYARSESRELQPNFKLLDVADILQRLESSYQSIAEHKGLNLKFRGRHCLIESDPLLLARLLGNLIHNAITYTGQGRILVTARQQGQELRLEVYDTGVGIPEPEQLRIFDLFYQVGNKAREATQHDENGFTEQHMGIGLSTVRNLTIALGGVLGIRSLPGRGSCFSLRLPLHQNQWGEQRVPSYPLLRLPLPRRLQLEHLTHAMHARATAASGQPGNAPGNTLPTPREAPALAPASNTTEPPEPALPSAAATAKPDYRPRHLLVLAETRSALADKLCHLLTQWAYRHTRLGLEENATPLATRIAQAMTEAAAAGEAPLLLLPELPATETPALLAALPSPLPVIYWHADSPEDNPLPSVLVNHDPAQWQRLALPLRPARLRALLGSDWMQQPVITNQLS